MASTVARLEGNFVSIVSCTFLNNTVLKYSEFLYTHCLSYAGIVSKRLNISPKCFSTSSGKTVILIFEPKFHYKIPRVTPSTGGGALGYVKFVSYKSRL